MRESFRALGRRLLQEGIAPRYVLRTINELRDHEADLIDEAILAGCNYGQAKHEARQRLGDENALLSVVAAHKRLHARFKSFNWQLYRLRTMLVPQEESFVTSPAYGPGIARWSMSICCSGMITFTLLFTMQAVIS
ncbi:MAG: hypothetical protein AAF438_21105 [Pseudomonadota bacterium]